MKGPLLSVLIPTLARREALFLGLLAVLLPQAEAAPEGVEVVALRNCGERPLGEYRDALMAGARGEYLCFADDDDMVTGDYVAEICKALASRPDVVGYVQACTGLAAPFNVASTSYIGYHPGPYQGAAFPGRAALGGQASFVRGFSHLMPVRSDLARKCSFQGGPAAWTHEDLKFADAMMGLLAGATEVFIDKALYTYRWNPADTTQWGPQAPYTAGPRPDVSSPCFRWLSYP